jgi:predicted TIM-barrel fold metal-dependent hydrolase
VVIDHFAQPTLSATAETLPTDLPGLTALLSSLSLDSALPRNIYIKLSGQYRLLPPSPTQPYTQLKQLFHRFLDAGGSDRLVWGSDWPHTRFKGIDTIGWAGMVVGWCEEYVGEVRDGGEEEVKRLVSRVFKDNADELWVGKRRGERVE